MECGDRTASVWVWDMEGGELGVPHTLGWGKSAGGDMDTARPKKVEERDEPNFTMNTSRSP